MRVYSNATDFVPTVANRPARLVRCGAAIVETGQPQWRKAGARPGRRCINHIGRISLRPRSQGGVKVPTGGNGERLPEPASACRTNGRVSRFGAIPKPTVTVRMEENGSNRRTHGVLSFEARIALILVS
jgi:hypothetical protein